ncbi:MAG: 8-oxo-dGTP diphosphatase [Lachnospiraceae bacterium]|nr:8-oxo-dGTP diphosphatase [Lachnospiraceae bacterium]
MKNTTLCYIEQNGAYLMLHRTKKKNDLNEGKWIGVGGKFEPDEMPEECLLREVKEETGLTLLKYRLRGIVTFVSDLWETEVMFLYTSNSFEGELTDCAEGELRWIPKEDIPKLRLWEGEAKFLRLLDEDSGFFSMKLCYQGDALADWRTKIYDENSTAG